MTRKEQIDRLEQRCARRGQTIQKLELEQDNWDFSHLRGRVSAREIDQKLGRLMYLQEKDQLKLAHLAADTMSVTSAVSAMPAPGSSTDPSLPSVPEPPPAGAQSAQSKLPSPIMTKKYKHGPEVMKRLLIVQANPDSSRRICNCLRVIVCLCLKNGMKSLNDSTNPLGTARG